MDENKKILFNKEIVCSETWERLLKETRSSGLRGLYQSGFQDGYERALKDSKKIGVFGGVKMNKMKSIAYELINGAVPICPICKENPRRQGLKTCSEKCSKKAYSKTEKYKKYSKTYYQKNKEKILASQRAYHREKHKEERARRELK